MQDIGKELFNASQISGDLDKIKYDMAKSGEDKGLILPYNGLDQKNTVLLPDTLGNLKYIFQDILDGNEEALNRPEFKALNFNNIKAAIEWLAKTNSINDIFKNELLAEGWRLNFKCRPPTPEEFLTEKYLGPTAETLYEPVRKAFIEFMNPLSPYRNAILSLHIGWGKAQPYSSLVATDYEEILENGEKKIKLKYSKIGDLKVNDTVITPGKNELLKAKVFGIQEQGISDIYTINLSDGTSFKTHIKHYTTVCFRQKNGEPVWDSLTTEWMMANPQYHYTILSNYNNIHFKNFLQLCLMHDAEPDDNIEPYIMDGPYIISIKKEEYKENCRCLSLNDPVGLYFTNNGILTHNSALSAIIQLYISTHFAMMWHPYKYFGQAQPLNALIKLPDGTYKLNKDLKVGDEIYSPTEGKQKIVAIIPQGTRELYEIEFLDGVKVKCNANHYWTVLDFTDNTYKVLSTREIIKGPDKYGFPDEEDCKRDNNLIIEAENRYNDKLNQIIGDQLIYTENILMSILDTSRKPYNLESFEALNKDAIDNLFNNQHKIESKRRQSYYYDNVYFDSSDELAFYISEKQKGHILKRNKRELYFEYTFNGKKHKYYPDFTDNNGNIYEVKGNHLINDSGDLINPFSDSDDVAKLYLAKSECIKNNKVVIISDLGALKDELMHNGINVYSYQINMSRKACAKYLWSIYKINNPDCWRHGPHNVKPYLFYNPDGITKEEFIEKRKAGIKFNRDQTIKFTCTCGALCKKTIRRLKNVPDDDILKLKCKACLMSESYSYLTEDQKKDKYKKSEETFKKNHPGITKGKFLEKAILENCNGDRTEFDRKSLEKRRRTFKEKYGSESCWAHINGVPNEKN